MSIEFKNIKRSTSSKKKLMLWIDVEICDAFEIMPPDGITVQEKFRQVLKHFIEGGFEDLETAGPYLNNPPNNYADELEGL